MKTSSSSLRAGKLAESPQGRFLFLVLLQNVVTRRHRRPSSRDRLRRIPRPLQMWTRADSRLRRGHRLYLPTQHPFMGDLHRTESGVRLHIPRLPRPVAPRCPGHYFSMKTHPARPASTYLYQIAYKDRAWDTSRKNGESPWPRIRERRNRRFHPAILSPRQMRCGLSLYGPQLLICTGRRYWRLRVPSHRRSKDISSLTRSRP